jgi:hypothetical protein
MVERAPRKVKLVRMGSLLVAVAPPGEKSFTHAQTAKAIRQLRGEAESHETRRAGRLGPLPDGAPSGPGSVIRERPPARLLS